MNEKQTHRVQLALRLERDLVEEIDEIARTDGMDRTELVRRLLRRGLAAHHVEAAVSAYAGGRQSAWAAAHQAGVSLYEMLDLIAETAPPYRIDPAALDRLENGPSSPPPGSAHPRGGATRLDRDAKIAQRRREFRPERVRLLFVGESSPAGGTHFYLTDSILFRAMRDALGRGLSLADPPLGLEFLEWFRHLGAWLVDLADRPVNRASPSARSRQVDAGVPALAAVIEEAHPDRIVVVVRRIGPAVARAARLAGFDVKRLGVVPFPVRQWRDPFVEQVAEIVRQVLRDGPRAQARPAVAEPTPAYRVARLHEAMALVLREAEPAPWMSAAAIAREIERRNLWRRPSDGKFPDATQVGARARVPHYRHLFETSHLGIRLRKPA